MMKCFLSFKLLLIEEEFEMLCYLFLFIIHIACKFNQSAGDFLSPYTNTQIIIIGIQSTYVVMHAWFVYLYIFGVWSCFVGKVESYSVVLSRNNIDNRRVYLAVLRSLRMLRRFLLMVDVILVFLSDKTSHRKCIWCGETKWSIFFSSNELQLIGYVNYIIQLRYSRLFYFLFST